MTKIRVTAIVAYLPELEMIQRLVDANTDMDCVAGFTDADRALEYLSEEIPDVLYINAQAPFDGIELTRYIHQHCPELPIIVYSVKTEQEALAFDAGAFAFLTMPIMPKKLLDAIRAAHGALTKR